ncbi:Hypothetical predicted protein [Podarcis lilfordi]|uniref:Uncharacterized protein n=1 Tax=Podarcis lilfordi TaxID=74358 RepID=A0AA35K3U7_9SAUR|nr:Hypothetical predicted protein [Podarcis lilfordi]
MFCCSRSCRRGKKTVAAKRSNGTEQNKEKMHAGQQTYSFLTLAAKELVLSNEPHLISHKLKSHETRCTKE